MRNWYNIGMGVGLLIGLIVILNDAPRPKGRGIVASG